MLLENILRLLLREFKTRERVEINEFAEKVGVDLNSILETVEIYGFETKKGCVYLKDRRKVIFNLLNKGFDLEDILRYFDWRDLEDICAAFLTINGFYTMRNLRFKVHNKRYEIDVIGIKDEKLLLIDCKKWKRMSNSMLKNAVKKQFERSKAFSEVLDTIKIQIAYDRVILIPAIVTMLPGDLVFYNSVPIIPITKFKNFLYDFENILDSLNSIEVKLRRLFESEAGFEA
mgnify:CR=1 FL=1